MRNRFVSLATLSLLSVMLVACQQRKTNSKEAALPTL